jgi:hypothetical protein
MDFLVDQLTVVITCVKFASSFYIFLFSSARFREMIKIYLKRLFNLGHHQIGPRNISLTRQPFTTRQIAREKVDPPIQIDEI